MEAFNDKIAQCESIINFTFSNKRLAAQALNRCGLYPKNDRLAIYGDAMLKAQLARKFIDTTLSLGKSIANGSKADNLC